MVCLTLLSQPVFGTGKLLLKSGFEPPVRISADMLHLLGVDPQSGCNWEVTPEWISSVRFVYSVGKSSPVSNYMYSCIETMAGPHGNQTKVLRMENKMTAPNQTSVSRNEFSFFMKAPPQEYREGYVKYWMKLQANLASLLPNDKTTPWYMIMEWKEPDSKIKQSDAACKECGEGPAGSNNYRINIGLLREAGAAQLRWYVTGERPQPCRKSEWTYLNPNAEVPLGKWFLVEAYLKKHATDGRVYFAIDGQVILDTKTTRPAGFTGRTQHAEHPLPLDFWSPLKNYHGMPWNAHGPVSQWYDDFELWSGFPPGHPAGAGHDARQ